MTTSKHQSMARQALPSTGATFNVPVLDDHAANLASLRKEYTDYLAKCQRRRDLERWNTDRLYHLATAADEYGRMFALDFTPLTPLADVRELVAFRDARDARLNTPENIAKRERARARREERREAKAAWRAGENISLPWGANQDDNGGALLRVRGDKLETSQGVSVPLAHAIRVFEQARLCRSTSTTWECNGHTLHVGEFQVDRLDADGTIHAGCHRINWPEIEAAAVAAGVARA